jgi:ribonuclease P/MRP protein subunit POP5
MKHLPKHLRPRWRYLAVGIEAWPDADLDRESFQRSLWYAAQDLLGDTGSATVDLAVESFAFADGDGESVVRTRRGTVVRARAVIACVPGVDGDPVRLRVRGVAGTVRSCEEKYMGRAPIETDQRDVVLDGVDRTAAVRAGRADLQTGTDGAFLGATTLDFD